MTGYYDYVLGLIPTALIGVTAFLNLIGLSPSVAVYGGALVAGGVMAHAMFVRSPVTGAGGGGDRSRGGAVGDALDRTVGQSQSRRRRTGGAD